MLYIDPSSVDMTKAVKDYTPSPGGGAADASARRQRHVLADRHLGRSDARNAGEGASLRRSARRRHSRGYREPANGAAAGAIVHRSAGGGTISPATTAPAAAAPNAPDRCTPGDERAILALGSAYASHWMNGDYERLGAMWSRGGDIVHPDGAIERGSQLITINRMQLFARREYRNTPTPARAHHGPLSLGRHCRRRRQMGAERCAR